jgi:hypothetical protein
VLTVEQGMEVLCRPKMVLQAFRTASSPATLRRVRSAAGRYRWTCADMRGDYGGAVFVGGGTPSFSNCTLSRNLVGGTVLPVLPHLRVPNCQDP